MPKPIPPKPARKYLADIPLPKDFDTPFVIPEEDATIIDAYTPDCDSLRLKKQLYNLHLQRLTIKAAPLAIAKITDLLQSQKPEVARRAAMTILQMSHLHSAPDLLPLDDEDFNDFNFEDDPEQDPPTSTATVKERKSHPPTEGQSRQQENPSPTPIENRKLKIETPPLQTFTLTTPPPKPPFNPSHLLHSLTTLLLLTLLFLHPATATDSPITNYHLPITASSTTAPPEPHSTLRASASPCLTPPPVPAMIPHMIPKQIQLLPDSLINKIAAGEVVERPASVVKELLENSIDAHATKINIAIEDGGRTLIRISDNGTGIPESQAPLAFAQHATSKIASTEDLFNISTMGFRGEALASIASVSHASLTTRTIDSPNATRIEVKDSLLSPPTPVAAPVGTTIEVRDLFYSVPARRKFLRTDSTEFSHAHEMVLRSALPNPNIAFTLSHNTRPVLELPLTTDHRLRVAEALLGNGEPAKEFYNHLIPIHFEERGITITGYAGQPALARPTAKYQYLFLNSRYIRDRSLFHALKESYRGLIEPSSQPVAILFLHMDPTLFDVNVHPQKTEVRFRDSGSIYRALLAALREKLLSSDLTPQVRTTNRFDTPTPIPQSNPSISDTRQVIADFFKQTPPTQQRIAYTPTPTPSPIDDPSRITFAPPPDITATTDIIPTPRFIQTHNTYIVSETPDGLVIIDQHALHERIIYEELFARATRGPLEGQRLLIPEILPINPRHAAALETVKPLLLTLGIEITDFDTGSIAVHSFPSLLSKVSPRDFLRDLLDKLLEIGAKLTPEELLHEVLDMASCKAAVKAGYPLSSDEIASLLARKEQVDRSSNCPHGRPTTLRLTISDLERQFKRK